jgi:hypothetical protein
VRFCFIPRGSVQCFVAAFFLACDVLFARVPLFAIIIVVRFSDSRRPRTQVAFNTARAIARMARVSGSFSSKQPGTMPDGLAPEPAAAEAQASPAPAAAAAATQ